LACKIDLPVQLPLELLRSLEGVKGFDKKAFINVHESKERITSIRINPFKKSEIVNLKSKITWTKYGYYFETRPSFTFDPLFHAGYYYVQEASSMFLEKAIKQTVDLLQPLRVLDLCAAPGGKSTHLLSLISKGSLLVSNEVIRPRANILNDNIVKWGCSNVIVTNNDPQNFQRLENYFDVIVIDAPCSGSGLFRRDAEAIEEWSEQNVALCSQRQQRILADVLPALKNGGVLIYSTCSYSKQEDEEIVDWLKTELIINNEELIISPEWNIVQSDGGYRFWPDKVKGEGFFIACFRKNGGDNDDIYLPKIKPEKFSNQEMEILNKNVNTDGLSFLRHEEIIYAVPEKLLADINFLSSKLRVVNYGTKVGEIIRNKLIPDHALALSNIVSDNIQKLELDHVQAIQYLKKKELSLQTDKKGWSMVTFQGHPLGWVNILPNRINNYYPKELRILKD
jgi:16S rRNA C967 or C1407 C5-methylase (RsmB/RsmF family)/NOL1/NOP2/fmu family ribosome biogenesis protein